jgi:hypothetical protein
MNIFCPILNLHWYKHPVLLLGNKKLFQVSFFSPEQFTTYKKITDHTRIECFIQSLFSLGLRDRKAGKQDVEELKKHKRGVHVDVQAKYIENSFGLKPGQVTFEYKLIAGTHFKRKSEGVKMITSFLDKELENMHATIISITLQTPTASWGHSSVAFKYNNKVLFFNPQSNFITDDPNDMADSGSTLVIYGIYETHNVKKSVELKDTTCPIEFAGGS